MRPAKLAPNLIDHFYRGGDRIAALRGIQTSSDRQPEEWLAATVCRAGEEAVGLSRTTSGELLRDLVAQDQEAWIGPAHGAARDQSDVGILFKLLDARQRLPVHVHPDRSFARKHLNCPYGKTESWLVLHTEPGGAVYLGWNVEVEAAELALRREAQDSEWMLKRMNKVEVEPGMGIFVPAGTIHSIGEGVFVAEVQEPTDFSILLEWSITTSTRDESHLGIGFDLAMQAASNQQLPPSAIDQLVQRNRLTARSGEARSLLPAAADPFFTLRLAAPADGSGSRIEAGFAIVLALSGSGSLVGKEDTVPVAAGEVLAIPYAFGNWQLVGDLQLLIGGPGVGWPANLNSGQQ